MTRRPGNGKRPTAQEKPTQIRCAIYCRKSTDENLDNDFNSLDAQREACEAYVASQRHEGWTCLPDRYDDPNCSGGSMDRPALRRLLTDVEAGRLDAVLTYKVDRLSRSLLDFARIFGKFDQHGVAFCAVTQSFNSATSSGRLMLNVLLSFSDYVKPGVMPRRIA